MLIELTIDNGQSILVNTDKIAIVQEETTVNRACLIFENANIKVNVRETFTQIKERCGLGGEA